MPLWFIKSDVVVQTIWRLQSNTSVIVLYTTWVECILINQHFSDHHKRWQFARFSLAACKISLAVNETSYFISNTACNRQNMSEESCQMCKMFLSQGCLRELRLFFHRILRNIHLFLFENKSPNSRKTIKNQILCIPLTQIFRVFSLWVPNKFT